MSADSSDLPNIDLAIPLVVDLDGTLIKTDTLHESVMGLAAENFFGLLKRAPIVFAGKSQFKAAIADAYTPDATTLPYRDNLLDFLREQKDAGRRIFLATAADQRIADAVAAHLELFEAAYGSEPGRNLGGARKAAFLVETFGEGGFDYAGDATVDRVVWSKSNNAILVGASAKNQKWASASLPRHHVFAGETPSGKFRLKRHIDALRPHQWLKNVLVFVPLAAAHNASPDVVWAALAAFVAFSLTASSVYILNDLLDLPHDRAHPRKRKRPFASGDVGAMSGLALGAICLLGGIALAVFATRWEFVATLAIYYALTLGYSFTLKRLWAVDVLCLAGLYTIRVIGGAMATGLVVSDYLLLFSCFFFLSLAVTKRVGELRSMQAAGKTKASGRAYTVSDAGKLEAISAVSAVLAVVVFAFYSFSPWVGKLYAEPLFLLAACPLLLFWLGRTLWIAHLGRMHDDPIVFAVKDPLSLLCGAGVVGLMAAGALL